jgi:hypothetical protein|tara:strand:- start:31 stop:618 length:588 start_codon:yes stop_codon:yes gene_type:complete
MKAKLCSHCKEEKTIDNFYKKSGRENQWQSYCKSCHLKRCNEARNKNPNAKRRGKKNWKEWSSKEENKIKRKDYQKRYYAKRSKQDPFYKLKLRMGSWVLHSIKSNNGIKEGSVWKYLPYTSAQLKEHLESQFEDWMTWENHGNGKGCWNVDHIYPQSLLPYDSLEHPNFQKCWALDNLQPLCAIENLRKSNKIT